MADSLLDCVMWFGYMLNNLSTEKRTKHTREMDINRQSCVCLSQSWARGSTDVGSAHWALSNICDHVQYFETHKKSLHCLPFQLVLKKNYFHFHFSILKYEWFKSILLQAIMWSVFAKVKWIIRNAKTEIVGSECQPAVDRMRGGPVGLGLGRGMGELQVKGGDGGQVRVGDGGQVRVGDGGQVRVGEGKRRGVAPPPVAGMRRGGQRRQRMPRSQSRWHCHLLFWFTKLLFEASSLSITQ